LLDDTALNAHQFRIGLADTRLCQCGQDIEDVHHYLLTCVKYESIRRDLLKCVDDGHCSSLSLTASLFLSPYKKGDIEAIEKVQKRATKLW